MWLVLQALRAIVTSFVPTITNPLSSLDTGSNQAIFGIQVLCHMPSRRLTIVSRLVPSLTMLVDSASLLHGRAGFGDAVVYINHGCRRWDTSVIDAKSMAVITMDEGKRGGKLIGTKNIIDNASEELPGRLPCPLKLEDTKSVNLLMGKRSHSDG